MNKEWSEYFRYICSMYSGEIEGALKDIECKTEEEKTACYYEQAALIVIKHFNRLLHETSTY